MSRYIINGGKPLKGEVSIRGAKNASFKQIITSLLTDQTIKLNNVPQISDVKITLSIAKSLGCQINQTGEHNLELITPKIINSTVPAGTGIHAARRLGTRPARSLDRHRIHGLAGDDPAGRSVQLRAEQNGGGSHGYGDQSRAGGRARKRRASGFAVAA